MRFIFTIRDSVSEKAGNLFLLDTIGEAERQFHDALKNAVPGSLFQSHPQDFSLHLIGEFDDETLSITNKCQLICTGKPNTETKVAA